MLTCPVTIQAIIDYINAMKGWFDKNLGAEAGGVSGWDDEVGVFNQGRDSTGTKTIWKDIGNGLFALDIQEDDIAYVNFHIRHGIETGSDVYPHIHIINQDAMTAGETIVFNLFLKSAKGYNQGDTFLGAYDSQIDLTYTADGTEIAGSHLILEYEDADAILAPEIDSVVMLGVTRKAGTYAGKTFGLFIDLHYKRSNLATIGKRPDFYVAD